MEESGESNRATVELMVSGRSSEDSRTVRVAAVRTSIIRGWLGCAGASLALGVVTLLAGCISAPKWMAQRLVTPDMVAGVLGEGSRLDHDIIPAEVPEVPVRTHLRPCCAFGTHLQASLGPVPVPFFSLGNIIGLENVGPHKYDSGALSIRGSSRKNTFAKENNGLIYTCRGGFIDTAHVRDYADWTIFWATAIARAADTGTTIELPAEGGKRRVQIRPIPRDLRERYGLRRVAVHLAQWVAFQLSVWHEISTAYGDAAIEFYPEYVSAFSPEDLYSNLLGIKMAGGLILGRGAVATDSLYDQNVDAWLHETLLYLHPVSVEAGEAAARLVDGVWWDSKARLPDPRLVLRRNSDLGEEISPWLISRAYSSLEMQEWIDRECGGVQNPVVLQMPESVPGVKFSDLLTLEIDVDVPDPFPFPREGSHRITQEDFPAVMQSLRERIVRFLGPDANRPELSAE
jgi:hypothetical protein